jgi:RNA polymerase sigma-70 factor (sigma-E family)
MTEYGGENFEAFVETEIPRLLTFAALIGATRDNAWDLVQDTLVRVGLRWTNLDPNRDLHAYAARVLLNLHYSRWRKLRRELPLGVHSDRDVELPGFAAIEARHELMQALRALPNGQRAVVVLRYFEDRTERETAEILGCSVGTVKSQHAKALEKLRRFVKPVTDKPRPARAAEEAR